jgi:hypothetical protein
MKDDPEGRAQLEVLTDFLMHESVWSSRMRSLRHRRIVVSTEPGRVVTPTTADLLASMAMAMAMAMAPACPIRLRPWPRLTPKVLFKLTATQ